MKETVHQSVYKSVQTNTMATVSREPLQARAEVNLRPGTERSLGMVELWAPLVQDHQAGKVLYGDLRLMGDLDDNSEFNAGVGYREIIHNVSVLGDGVAGIHAWFDSRSTERGSKFNQVTLGGEWKGDNFDILANGYVPLSDDEIHTDANPTASNSGFVGTQVLVNTAQTVKEEPLAGVDLEFGYRLPIFEDSLDVIRAYAGGFHFLGGDAESVSGGRVRFQADVTSDISVGARYQYDDVRDDQAFLDVTLRFPWGNKKTYQDQGLYARLDESPERDIDIVSNDVVTDNGIDKTLVDATTGQAINVYHVDNTAAGGGDGSAETPFNTLVAAQGAAGGGDVIYVHRGDGTSAGQNAGITLANDSQILTGSGVDFTFDSSRYRTSNGNSISNNVMVSAGAAPVLANGAGNGITVTADNVSISGVTIDGATDNGVFAQNVDNLNISQVTSNNNTNAGFRIEADAATINEATFSGNTANGNGGSGFSAIAENVGTITAVNYSNNTADNNTIGGFFASADGTGSSLNVDYDGNSADTNTTHGFYVQSINDAVVGDASFSNNTSTNNTGNGFFVQANQSRSSLEVSFDGNTADTNGSHGFYINALNDANISRASLSGNTATNNTGHGVYIDDDSATGSVLADLGGGSSSSTGGNIISSNTATDIRVDMDGAELKAENNWWGVVTGLAGGETTLDDASTIDTDPFLTTSP